MIDTTSIQHAYDQYADKRTNRITAGINASHVYLEKPAMYGKLPQLQGKKVLCIGCGSGEECKYLQDQGAEVVGIDLSVKLIRIAKRNYPTIRFIAADMQNLSDIFEAESFDYAYSSLTMHYLPKRTCTLQQVRLLLKKGGVFIFSTHHPIKRSAEKSKTEFQKNYYLGYEKNKKDGTAKVFGDYLNTRKITDIWFNDFEVCYYHKPLSEIIPEIIESGFTISDFLEPKATSGAKDTFPEFWKVHQKIPLFMIFELRK